LRLLLASASPRRSELLAAAGFSFDVIPVDIDERHEPTEAPADHVLRLAHAKAGAVAGAHPGRVVLGADTIVLVDGAVLGKPSDDRHAAEMLRALSGRVHEVLTGVAVHRGAHRLGEVERTRVCVAELTDREIVWYVASGEPRDKAGAYAVQGLASRFITRIEGSYSNVVGLPIALVYRLLGRLGAI
jgi:septum formation protein